MVWGWRAAPSAQMHGGAAVPKRGGMLQTPVSLCLGMPCPLPPIQEAAESSSSQGVEEEAASPLLQIGSCSGYTEMRIKLKQNEAFPGPKVSQTRSSDLPKAVPLLHPRNLGILFKSWKQERKELKLEVYWLCFV